VSEYRPPTKGGKVPYPRSTPSLAVWPPLQGNQLSDIRDTAQWHSVDSPTTYLLSFEDPVDVDFMANQGLVPSAVRLWPRQGLRDEFDCRKGRSTKFNDLPD
jgi:hypothetical protein